MPNSIQRCLVFINALSGQSSGRNVFASSIQPYLDERGFVYRKVLMHKDDIHRSLQQWLPSADRVIVCGGDGTVHAVANAMATTRGGQGGSDSDNTGDCSKPIFILPAGYQNGIAHSLGIHSADHALRAFIAGDSTEPVPLMEVRVDGIFLTYALSHVSVGLYADVVQHYAALNHARDKYAVLPLPLKKLRAAALYTTMMRPKVLPCRGATFNVDEGVVVVEPPLRMAIVSQMPLHDSNGYSLTPRADYRTGGMAVTAATSEASRLRLLHLLLREVVEGQVLEEDGVRVHQRVSKASIHLAAAPENVTDEDGACARYHYISIDGEATAVPAGSVLTVERSHMNLPFVRAL